MVKLRNLKQRKTLVGNSRVPSDLVQRYKVDLIKECRKTVQPIIHRQQISHDDITHQYTHGGGDGYSLAHQKQTDRVESHQENQD